MHLVAIGGSDAGISAALRARELDPNCDVTVVVADSYPNFSICGIPYYVSGEVAQWQHLAHRSVQDLEATGMHLRLNTVARRIQADGQKVLLSRPDGEDELVSYDALIIGTGARSIRPPIDGLVGTAALGPSDGVHLLHSMGDTFELMETLEAQPSSAIIVGAGYIGLEMAESLTNRGIAVIQIEQLPEVLPTVDPELGAMIHAELVHHGVEVLCNTAVRSVRRASSGSGGRIVVEASGAKGDPVTRSADLVLVVVGVRPDTEFATSAGVELGAKNAIAIDRCMRTNVPGIFAAGDCAVTHHRLLGSTYLPLGTTAHKQGRVAGENALGGGREFAGSLGTQVVRVFDAVAARTGLRDHEAVAAGFNPLTVASQADDHKAYYPGSHPIAMRYTGDRQSGRLLGLQLVGRLGTEVAKRIDVAAAAIFNSMTVDEMNDLDLSYSPPLGSPWDAVQVGAQAWSQESASLH
jgi:NADPH-dependent 2,4-dienoyl-CoA reductase/sulfur reductase-like enzyme